MSEKGSFGFPRRDFLQKFFMSLASVTVVSQLTGLLGKAYGEDLPLVGKEDPLAKTFNYVTDSSKVDKAKFPQHAADQKCGTCALYTAIDKKHGKCQLFAGKSVAQAGWCSSFVKK
jgi:hypothetical protein